MRIPTIKGKVFIKEYLFILLYKDKNTGMLESYSKNDFRRSLRKTKETILPIKGGKNYV